MFGRDDYNELFFDVVSLSIDRFGCFNIQLNDGRDGLRLTTRGFEVLCSHDDLSPLLIDTAAHWVEYIAKK